MGILREGRCDCREWECVCCGSEILCQVAGVQSAEG